MCSLRQERFAGETVSDLTACLSKGMEQRVWMWKQESVVVKSKVHALHLLWMGRWVLGTQSLEGEK